MARIAKRRISGPTSEKMAITLPRELAEAVRAEAKARQASSVSAFIAAAVAEKIEHDRLQDVIDEILGDQPMTDEERAWADQYLVR